MLLSYYEMGNDILRRKQIGSGYIPISSEIIIMAERGIFHVFQGFLKWQLKVYHVFTGDIGTGII